MCETARAGSLAVLSGPRAMSHPPVLCRPPGYSPRAGRSMIAALVYSTLSSSIERPPGATSPSRPGSHRLGSATSRWDLPHEDRNSPCISPTLERLGVCALAFGVQPYLREDISLVSSVFTPPTETSNEFCLPSDPDRWACFVMALRPVR